MKCRVLRPLRVGHLMQIALQGSAVSSTGRCRNQKQTHTHTHKTHERFSVPSYYLYCMHHFPGGKGGIAIAVKKSPAWPCSLTFPELGRSHRGSSC
jgi:hypothetical protein